MKYIILAAVIAATDQCLKMIVIRTLGLMNEIPVIENFFYIHCIANDGIAMGMLADRQSFVIAFTGIVMLLILIYIIKNRKSGKSLTLMVLSVIAGGGTGNIIDRIRLNYVIDYIDFRIWPYIFNFADICVVSGCFVLLISAFTDIKKEKSP